MSIPDKFALGFEVFVADPLEEADDASSSSAPKRVTNSADIASTSSSSGNLRASAADDTNDSTPASSAKWAEEEVTAAKNPGESQEGNTEGDDLSYAPGTETEDKGKGQNLSVESKQDTAADGPTEASKDTKTDSSSAEPAGDAMTAEEEDPPPPERMEVTQLLEWCEHHCRGGDPAPKGSGARRLLSVSAARVDFKRYLVAAYYRRAAGASEEAVGAAAPAIPDAAFKVLFPRLHAAHMPKQSAVLTLAADPESMDQTWTAFQKAVKSMAKEINAVPDLVRSSTRFCITVGPSDEGVEVVVLHNCTTTAEDGENEFLPDTPPRKSKSSTCVLL